MPWWGLPRVQQAPVSIECRVRDIIPLGSHDMFLADVVNVWADTRYIDPVTGEFRLADAHLIAYSHGHYHKLGEEIRQVRLERAEAEVMEWLAVENWKSVVDGRPLRAVVAGSWAH